MNSDKVNLHVQKIFNKRVTNGIVEYEVQLQGQNESSWEFEDQLDCPDLLTSFEKVKEEKKEQFLKDLNKRKSRKLMGPNIAKKKSDRKEGFDRGVLPERILGATDASGELMFLMKWKDTDEADLVPAKQANVKCPQIVIQFYEERMTWHSSSTTN